MLNQIRTYYQLTKPGIIYGNLLTASAGFLLAAATLKQFDLELFVVTLASIAFIIAAACVLNNYIDRDIDKKMARTKKRALASGAISGRQAITYAVVLGVAGFIILAAGTNLLTTGLGMLAIIMYVVVYGIAKRRSIYGTLVGSVSGALPPVAGYTALTNQLDAGAIIIFLIVTFWQMPHFYAIAMFRRDEYAAASIPVWPIKKGMRSTKIHVLFFIVAFIVAAMALTWFGYTGLIYLAGVTIIGLRWLWLGLKGFQAQDDVSWARKMFFFSLLVILLLSVLMPLGALLP